jgi:kynurenine formamidase
MCLIGTIEAVRKDPQVSGPRRVSRRAFLSGAAGTTVAAFLSACSAGTETVETPTTPGLSVRSVRDLTHPFRAGFPVYTGASPVRRNLKTIERDGFYSQEWTFGEHSGTHVDVPGHFVAGGRLAPQMRPEELVIPAVVIDISDRAGSNPDADVTLDDLEEYERRNGRIPGRAGVFVYSGWEERLDDPDSFLNRDPAGTFHFPGFGKAALDWLLREREISCIGVDTLSLDPGNSTTFDVHKTLLGADLYGIENLANLRSIPARGATVIVGLIPWEDGSGGPARVLALAG